MGAGYSTPSSGNTNQSGNQGSVYNYYYQQHYQNSIDASGALSTVEHGNSGSMANSTNNTSGGGGGGGSANPLASAIDGLASIATVATAGMLLDQTTEEQDGVTNSDRINTTVAGNTAVNTQASVGTLLAYGCDESKFSGPLSSTAENPSQFIESVQRGYTFQLTGWTTTQVAYNTCYLDLPYAVTNGMFQSFLSQHYLYRSGFDVLVQVNASPFHAGCLAVVMIPECLREGQAAFQRLLDWSGVLPFAGEQVTIFPFQLLNLRTNTVAHVRVPYVGCSPASYSRVHCPWTLAIVVLTPLTYTQGSSPSVEVSVTIRPTAFQASGLRQPVSQGLLGTDSHDRQFISSEPTQDPPGYVPGWRPSSDWLHGEVHDFNTMLARPTFATLQGNVPYFRITNTNQTTPHLSIDMTLSATHWQRTYIACLGRFFTQYRGSIVVHLTFTGAAVSRGKLLLAYIPPGEEPSDIETAMLATNAVWDLGLNSTFAFVIPYISVTDYRFTNTLGNLTTLNIDGWFQIYSLTPLTYPAGAPASGDILVSVSAGTDFCFRYPCDDFTAVRSESGDDGDGRQPTDNLETGQTTEQDASVALNDHILGNLSATSHTNISFLLDRYFLARVATSTPWLQGPASGTVTSPPPAVVELVPHIGSSSLTQLLQSFTYYTCDLSIRVVTDAFQLDNLNESMWDITPTQYAEKLFRLMSDNDSAFTVAYYPPGAPIPRGARYRKVETFRPTDKFFAGTTQTVSIATPDSMYGGLNPYFVSRIQEGLNVVSFTVPYCSPTSNIPTVFCGNASYTGQGAFGTVPEVNFGRVVIYTNRSNVLCKIHFRVRNLRVWCPRPLPAPTVNVTSNTPSRSEAEAAVSRSLLMLAGDVESNPGPPIVSTLSGMWTATQAITKLSTFIGKAKAELCEPKLAVKIIKFLIKCVGLADAIRKKAWVAAAALASDFLDLADVNPIEKAVDAIFEKFGVKLPVKKTTTKAQPKEMSFSFWGMHKAYKPPLVKVQQARKRIMDRMLDWGYDDDLQAMSNPFLDDEDDIVSESGFSTFLSCARNLHWLITTIKDAIQGRLQYMYHFEETKEGLIDTYVEHLSEIARPKFSQRPFYKEQAKKCRVAGLGALSEHWLQAYNKACDVSRPEPVVVCLRGEPGQGKSVSAVMLAQALACALTGDPSDYWSKPPDSDFYDGYAGQSVVIMDDLGQNPSGEDYRHFCQMVSTAPFFPPLAAVNEKGTPFTSKIIIVTTNKGAGFLPVTISDPTAIARRMTIQATVKAKYKTSKGCLDLAKAIRPTGKSKFGMFEHDCGLLNGDALEFQISDLLPIWNKMSLYDLLKHVIDLELKRRKIQQGTLSLFKVVSEAGDDSDTESEEDDDMCESDKEILRRIKELQVPNDEPDSCLDRSLKGVLASRVLPNFKLRVLTAFKSIKFPRLDQIVLLMSLLALVFITIQTYFLLKKASDSYDMYPAFEESVYDSVPNKQPKKTLIFSENRFDPSDFLQSVVQHESICRLVFVLRDGRRMTSTGFFVNESMVTVPKHSWDEDWVCIELDGVPIQKPQAIIYKCESGLTDLVLMHVPGLRPRRNRLSNFTNTSPKPGTPIYTLMAQKGSVVTSLAGNYLGRFKDFKTADNDWMRNVCMYQLGTARGLCGAPIFCQEDGTLRVCAIHCAGNGKQGFGTIITKDTLAKIIQALRDHVCGIRSEGMTELDPIDYFHTPAKSSLRKTILYDATKTTSAPAVLSARDPRLAGDVDFKAVLLEKYKKVAPEITPEVKDALDTAVEAYSRVLRNQIGTDHGMVSYEEAVQGIGKVDPVDLTTSPGYPFNKRGESRADLVWNKDFIQNVKLRTLFPTEVSKPIFHTFLKDELRPLEKVRCGNTRTIEIEPFDHLLFGRRLLLKVQNSFLERAGLEIGSAIGLDPDVAWPQIGLQLAQYNYCYDADFSKFDSSHSKHVMQACAQVLLNIGVHPNIVHYVDDLCNSTHGLWDMTFQTDQGLPSGCSGTSLLNTIMNNIVTRAAFYLASPNYEEGDFKMMAYGDDLILASNYQLDMNKLAKAYAKLGYKVTPASKAGTFPEVSTLSDVTFLKRSFAFEHGVCRPRMDKQNLYNILSWVRTGELEAKLASVSGLAVHSGRETYDFLFDPFLGAAPSYREAERSYRFKLYQH